MGSFGVVQKARWHTTVVAVKRAHEEVRGKQVIDTIRDEIEKWSRVRHPNVAEMLGACIQTDKPFLVTRYYRHGNLHSYINSHPKLPIIQRIKWFYDIASGLEHIHRVGIIHGDLKGDNVLLDDTYAAIITDFGLSQLKRTCSSNSSHNETVAKKMTEAIRWIAPERYARKFKLAPSYDVFAFGMTCYEVLTGRVPYFDESNEQVVKEKIREGILPERPDNIEDPVWKMLTKCLIKEPENR
ncbi:kinase-like domain-containing protein, partial [Gorgonomyces haynaldii]